MNLKAECAKDIQKKNGRKNVIRCDGRNERFKSLETELVLNIQNSVPTS